MMDDPAERKETNHWKYEPAERKEMNHGRPTERKETKNELPS